MARVNRATIELAAKDNTRAAFASVQGNFKGLQGQVDAIGARFGSLQTTIVSTLTGFGLGAFLTGVADQLDAFNDLADATGASIANLSRLDVAVRRTGGTFDDVSALLTKFNQSLLRAKPGSDQAAAFEALGLSVAELRKQDPAEALLTTARAFQQYDADGEAARAQTLLLGESVRKLAPVLKDLAEASVEVGGVTQAQAEAADRFNKSMARVTATAQDLARNVVADLLPVVTATLEAFEQGDAQARKFAGGGGLLRTAFEALVIAAANVEFVLGAIGREIGAVAAQLVALGRLDLQGFSAISDAVREDGQRARAELDAFEQRILTAGRGIAQALDEASAAPARRKLKINFGGDDDTAARRAAARAAELAAKQAEAQRAMQALLDASSPLQATVVNSLLEFGDVVIDLPTQILPAVTAQQQLEDGFERIQKAALSLDLSVPVAEVQRLDDRTVKFLDNVQDLFGDTLYKSLKGDFDNILELWADLLLRMLAEAAAADFAHALGFGSAKNDGGNLSKLLDGIVGVFAGTGRANGGAVKRGGLYPINEIGGPGEVLSSGGRQYLLAAENGYVTPGRSAGVPVSAAGGVTNNITIQTLPGTSAETSRSTNASGGMDILVRMVRQTVRDDLASKGPISRDMAGTFGLNRATGAPRRS